MRITPGGLKLITVLGLCCLMPFSASCAKTSENNPAPESGEQQNITDIKTSTSDTRASVEYKIDGEDAEFEVDIEKGVSVPDDYPSDIVPAYPNGSVTLSGKQGDTYTLVIKTDDSVDDIYSFYEENLSLDTLELTQNSSEIAMISGMADELYVSIMVTKNIPEDGGNLITIAVGN